MYTNCKLYWLVLVCTTEYLFNTTEYLFNTRKQYERRDYMNIL